MIFIASDSKLRGENIKYLVGTPYNTLQFNNIPYNTIPYNTDLRASNQGRQQEKLPDHDDQAFLICPPGVMMLLLFLMIST